MDILPSPSRDRTGAAEALRAAQQAKWVSAPRLATELGISRRTLSRWLQDGTLGLPQPMIIYNRIYFERSAIDQWKNRAAGKVARGV